jgi:hypothetical protein
MLRLCLPYIIEQVVGVEPIPTTAKSVTSLIYPCSLVVGLVLTGLTVGIFIRHINTPVVKSSR